MEDIVEKLLKKLREVREQKRNLTQNSQGKEKLIRIEKTLEKLINSYFPNSPSPDQDYEETENILNQWELDGFEDIKKKIIQHSIITNNGVNLSPLTILLVGPPGTGKTSFAKNIAKALKKEIFVLALGSCSDSAILVGSENNSWGQLASALSLNSRPLIVLDEIDKINPFRNNLHDCLLSMLDPEQNREVFDYFLGTDLDCSGITFIATANDINKIPPQLLSRMTYVCELKGYNFEEKEKIARRTIKSLLENYHIDDELIEITDEFFENLISKTHEKGIRQLKSGIESIFRHCLLRWINQDRQGIVRDKIMLNSLLVNEVIPYSFPNIDSEGENSKSTKESSREFVKTVILTKENDPEIDRNKIESEKSFSLRVILKAWKTNKTELKEEELNDYKKIIENSNSLEEIKNVREKALLHIEKKSKIKSDDYPKEFPREFSNRQLSPKQEKEDLDLNKKINEIISERERERERERILSKQNFSKKNEEELREEIRKLKTNDKNLIKKNNEQNWFILFIITNFIFMGLIIFFMFKLIKIVMKKTNKN